MSVPSQPRPSDEDNYDCRNSSTSQTYPESQVTSATATWIPTQASPDPQNSTMALASTDESSSDIDEVSLDELDKLRRLSLSSRGTNEQTAQEWPEGYAFGDLGSVTPALHIRRDNDEERHRRDETSSPVFRHESKITRLALRSPTPFSDNSDTDHKRMHKPPEEKEKVMPSHLVPFIPYIEKDMDTAPGCNEWTKETLSLIQVIRKWLQTCDDLHLGRCGKNALSDASPWSSPLLLIDVKDGCLVPAPPEAKYVALSYVWGGDSASSCTTNETIGQLQQLNGLYGSTVTLPRTIMDAIKLVRRVGERYLWCDRFCIIQDESVTKQCQLNAMGNIYAGACFTLVAAQSDDASGGLYTEKSMLRVCPPTSSPGMSSKQILLDQAMHLMRTKWYSRSWTFQEFLFSKRKVIFHNDTVNWECLYSSWHKSQDMPRATSIIHPPSELPRKLSYDDAPWNGFKCSPWPDISRYARLVSLFNPQNLTYPEDVLDAFAGVLSQLSCTFPGSFISGLPQMHFDAALTWQPWHYMERRKSIKCSASDAVLPSWSWVGWAGDLNSESWRSAANYLLEPDDEEHPGQQCSWKTISTVKWNYSISRTSSRKEIYIHAQFLHPVFNPTSESLPHGWSSRANPAHPDQVLYYHSSDPSHPFRYPIPIRDQHIAHMPPISARYLHCTTAHAFLKLGSAYQSIASDCPAVELIAEDGRWAGVLRLNCMPWDFAVLIEEVKTKNRGLVELIEISAGSVDNQTLEENSFDEWNREGCPRQKGLYVFFNVLWVEWVDRVAYRKTLGRVTKDIWEEVATERIDVTLG